ncbi:MAG: hypothetical protein GY768_14230 [Planctomycetaceae bacterium]|nr:hypothetical protein [Planctomycetaceae bacterium]
MNPSTRRKIADNSSSTRQDSSLPSWLTTELVEKTLQVWQPHYSYRLTRDDAIAIIKSVGQLFEVLRQEPIDETVCCDSESE